MRQVVNLNRSGKVTPTPVIPEPSAPGLLPQHPEAEEYAGIAFIVTSSGDILNPVDVRSVAADAPRWLLACSLAGSQPTQYRVETVYQLMNISDPFDLASKRSGSSVQVAFLSAPGRGDIDLTRAGQVSIINVHFDDFQAVLDTPCLFRPAFDRLTNGNAWVSAWDFDIPKTDPSAFASGSLKWTGDDGVQKSMAVTRTPRTSISKIGVGDILTQHVDGSFGGSDSYAIIQFNIPFGVMFFDDIPGGAAPSKLMWMCWYKQTGHQLYLGFSDAAGMADLEQHSFCSNTALLYRSLYYR